MMPDRAQSLLIVSVALALCVGLLLGRIAGFAFDASSHPPLLVSQSGSSVATVVLEGFRDGALRGHAEGPLRLFVHEEAVAIDAEGDFAIVHPSLRIEEVTIAVPPGMRFVASKRGKKYYSVTSSSGEGIAPENRIYFPDAASAEAAGYIQ